MQYFDPAVAIYARMDRKLDLSLGPHGEGIEEFAARIGSEFVRLIRTEEHFNVALRLAGVSAFRVNRALCYDWIFSSKFASQDVGATLVGTCNQDLFAPESAALLDRLYTEVFRCGKPLSFDAHLTRLGTQQEHHLEIHLEPIPAEDGQIAAISGSALDLSPEDARQLELHIARRQADEACAQAQQARHQADAACAKADEARMRAEQANRLKTSLMAAASHDLRQPLQAMSLFQGMVVKRLQAIGDPTGLRAADAITRAISSAEELLTSLMDFAVIESGRVEVHLSDFSVDEVVADSIGDFREIARQKGLRLRVLPCAAMIHSDRTLLKRIVRNLTINAIKYTERGGLLIGCRRRRNSLRIEVWDSGRGIPEDKLATIFQEFYRGNAAIDSGDGLGIGLSIVAGMARLLGLEVTVRSRVGKGSLFAVAVPLAPPGRTAAAGDRQPAAGDPAGGGQTEVAPERDERSILIVEDEAIVALGMSVALEDAGIAVAGIVDTGDAALRNAARRRPALALMDINLRGPIDGIEAARQLGERFGVPVLYVTGQADEATKTRALGITTPCGYLLKPFTPECLVAAVRAAFDHTAGGRGHPGA